MNKMVSIQKFRMCMPGEFHERITSLSNFFFLIWLLLLSGSCAIYFTEEKNACIKRDIKVKDNILKDKKRKPRAEDRKTMEHSNEYTDFLKDTRT